MFKSILSAAAFAIAALGLVGTGAAQAADCPRGTLDKQYCDYDGDLVADLPLDSKQWVNPDTIIFSYTPVEDPAVYAKVWDGFVQHMAKVTGKNALRCPACESKLSFRRADIAAADLHYVGSCRYVFDLH